MNLKDFAEKVKVNWVRVGFDPKTEQTKFIAIINGEHFDFNCGLFACIPDKKQNTSYNPHIAGSMATYNPLKRLERAIAAGTLGWGTYNYDSLYKALRSGRAKALPNWGTWGQKLWDAISMLCSPTAYDLLYCLQSDSRADSMSFNDFCGDFGYDNDSIKALNTYNACIDNARKLRKALGADYKTMMECEPD